MKNIYLDNNATTPLLPEVFQEIEESLKIFGNPSSPHAMGISARKKMESSRQAIAEFINADPAEIVFTSGGTESIATALNCATSKISKKVIITSAVEHAAVLEAVQRYGKIGFQSHYIEVDKNGNLNINDLNQKLKDNSGAFLSVMYVNNETGVIFPINNISEYAKQYGALVHVDAVQAAGKIPIDVKKMNCDYLSLSVHKFHGLKGTGVLYIKKRAPYTAFIRGHQEKSRRGGTENVIGIVSLGAAARAIQSSFLSDTVRMKKLRDAFENWVLGNFPNAFINGRKAERVCNTSSITLPGTDAALLVEDMSRQGLHVSTGAACTTGGKPSHVLKAMGITDDLVSSSLRVSLSKQTTADEMESAFTIFSDTVNKIKIKPHAVS